MCYLLPDPIVIGLLQRWKKPRRHPENYMKSKLRIGIVGSGGIFNFGIRRAVLLEIQNAV